MLFTKERNSNKQNLGIETSNLSLKVVDIFDNSNNYFSSSVNSFRASDRSSYTTDQTYKDLPKSNENNKNTTQAMSLVTSSAVVAAVQPDLIIQNAINPTVGSVGGSIEVSYQVKNQGTGSSASYHQTKFYLSTNTTLSNDDTYLDSDYFFSSIAAGAYSASTTTINISNSIAAGNYYLLYQADGNNDIAESNESNNIVAKAISIKKADLIIQNAINPTVGSVGESIEVSYQVKNQGAGSAGYNETKFYLSTNTTLSNDDIYLGYDFMSPIAGGAYDAVTSTINISDSIATGNYYLLYQADGDNDIAESNESNNIVAKAISIKKADLIIQNAINPTVGSVGGSIEVNYQVKNQGAGSAGYNETKFYLSTNTTLSNDDIYLGYDFMSPIATGAYDAVTSTINISDSIATGNYYLLYQADGDNDIAESNESNNIVAKAIAIKKADLIIQNAINPSVGTVGENIEVSYQVKNQGAGSAGYNETKFYLSTNTTLSNDDIYLGYDFFSPIATGAYSAITSTINISDSIAAGNYYLLYQADGNNDIAESNESNNIVAKAIAIKKADLIIQNAVNPTTASTGGNIQISYQVKNQGAGNAGYSYTKLYLSKDQILSNEDMLLNSEYTSSIASGSYSSETFSIQISKTIAGGSYYILYQADGSNNIAESNESNNIVAKAITIIKNIGYDTTDGYGLINAAAAVAKALGQTTFADVPNLGGEDWGADLVKAPEVWAKGYTGKGVVVAVLDTGVDRNHSDLSNNIWKNTKEIAGNGKDDDGNGYIDDVYGWNFDSNNNNTLDGNSHGTHVAGTIAGVKNGVGVTGIAYDAKIMPVKVLSDSGSGEDSGVAKGIRYAVENGANVINLSLGGDEPNSEIESAIQYAASKGVIVVMAAGNSSGSEPIYPARYAKNWGLAVGAIDKYQEMAYFSNEAGATTLPYVTAPGVDIYSTLPGNSYGFKDGTSMATPHVAGVIALMLSAKKGLTDAQVRQIVTSTAGNSLA
ncbi:MULTISPECIES: CARDB domain-containing protein [Nostoc]|uniref:S8 family serine peptidase n=1 Tax=Nostoc paludosum FACHB-159 TaxID=2692908 RepID=A0ABR8KEG0_9NOSO|nr:MULTISPECIES: CARDB domain-containing protein [Nostoc]MBD2680677.1 S8 family serine peptidase [Nostoc sp. FACHB-857]MBD2737219.1 S8 family serine peptidase [Nostoc paludosum FACHB-159]